MAKPKSDLPPVAEIRALADTAGRLALHVIPGARQTGLEIVDGCLIARVRARPEDGKATAAVLKLLAQALGIAPSRLHLLRGATSRQKLVQLGD
jgi:uncharacterized protein YggU (UPF0235/DUF167 family)